MTRFLVGFSDTEGVPNKKGSKSSLWNFFTVISYIVDLKGDRPVIERVFHTLNLSIPKHQHSESDVIPPLECHLASLAYLKQIHSCDRIYLCFWNAPHDMGVLKHYNVNLGFSAIDLLRWARRFAPLHKGRITSFSLKNLSSHFNLKSNKTWDKAHTGIGDTFRMIELLPLVSKFENEYDIVIDFLGLRITETKNKPKTDTQQYVETELGRNECGTAEKTETPTPPKGSSGKGGGDGDGGGGKTPGGGVGLEDKKPRACGAESVRKPRLEAQRCGPKSRVPNASTEM